MAAAFTGRDHLGWAAGFLLVATVIVVTGFRSADPDSALYAGLAGRLTEEPIARWVAPEWWGFWPDAGLTGYFREHPAGILWAPAALARIGLPAEPSAYVVGALASLVALVLIGTLVARVTTGDDARAAIVLLQIMPVAFIFRLRANHEYPMLVCLLLVILGIEALRRSRWAALIVAAGLSGGLLIKGVFVSLIIMGGTLWLIIDPLRSGSDRRPLLVGMTIAVLITLAIAAMYDALAAAATGEAFWSAYWARQMGPLAIATPWEDLTAILSRAWFYVTRLLWHPAPWSLALVWLSIVRSAAWQRLPRHERRALIVGVAFVIGSLAVLSLPSRYAERYAFSASFVLGTIGAIAARRSWPALQHVIKSLDSRIPALPAVVWTTLALARLALGPYLPRIEG